MEIWTLYFRKFEREKIVGMSHPPEVHVILYSLEFFSAILTEVATNKSQKADQWFKEL